jgi:predicted DNA-binding transcriptional regulator AlpA
MEEKQLVSIKEASKIVGLGRSTIYKLMKSGLFVTPCRIPSIRKVLFKTGELQSWINKGE